MDGPGFEFRSGKSFVSSPKPADRLWTPPSFLLKAYASFFPEAKPLASEVDHPPFFIVAVCHRMELYLITP